MNASHFVQKPIVRTSLRIAVLTGCALLISWQSLSRSQEPKRPVLSSAPQAPLRWHLESPPLRWFKGNTHVHTELCGHADSTPAAVTQWYHERGYNFLCLSEHNQYVDPATVELPKNKRSDFMLIPGQEITGHHTIHTTALNTKSLVDWRHKHEKKSEVIQNHVDGTHHAHGVPILNHPNFHYAISAEDMLPVKRLHLFELYNGHPGVNNLGDDKHPSTEQIWDTLLSAGALIYGVSSDDAHQFKKWAKNASNPGRGWIMVRSAAFTADAITQAIHRGDFYASSGVMLREVSFQDGRYRVVVDEAATARELASPILYGRRINKDDAGERKAGYSITFIGPGGKILQTSQSTSAEFKVNQDSAYVRCKVTYIRNAKVAAGADSSSISADSNADREEFASWTQPVFTDDRIEKARLAEQQEKTRTTQ